jgi:hypothetical protein
MIFFTIHYFISPLYSRKKLRTRATVKLLISCILLLLVLFLWASTPLLPGFDLRRFIFEFLTVELMMDIGCFSCLLSSGYESQRVVL